MTNPIRILTLFLMLLFVIITHNLFAQDTIKLLSPDSATVKHLSPDSTEKPETEKEETTTMTFVQQDEMTMPVPKKRYTDYPYYFQLQYDFYTTLMASFAKNPIDPSMDKSNMYFYYNVTLNNRLQLKKVRINTYLFNEFGKRFYLDSINTVSEDLYYFKNTLNYPLLGKDNINLNFMINIKSQLWEHYDYTLDSLDRAVRYLYSSYYTPGYMLFSGGLGYSFWEGCAIDFGIAGGKITKIKNQRIFEERGTDVLYGVEKGNKRKVVFGLNLQVNIMPKIINKHLAWENYTQLFIPNQHLGEVKYYTLDFNNAIHYLFLKYMRISLRTTINHDLDIQDKPQIINQITVGFYLSNIVQ